MRYSTKEPYLTATDQAEGKIKVPILNDLYVAVITSTKEVMVSVAFVCLSVSNILQESYERIAMKFYGWVQVGTIND